MVERRLTLFTIITVFLLLLLGALVHNTESSLACPDWPLCYGQFFPKMEGGVLIEHSHRLLASLVGFLTILIVVFIHRNRTHDLHARRVSWAALGMVILQGILGGITVIYRLPTIVSTCHLTLSLVYFSTLIYLHQYLSAEDFESWSEKLIFDLKRNWSSKIKEFILIGMSALFAQIILGAFVRHSGVGTACGLGVKSAVQCLDANTWELTWWPSITEAQLHMTHRVLAIIVMLLIFYACFLWLRMIGEFKSIPASAHKQYLGWGVLPVILIFIQAIFGMALIAFNMHVVPITAHLGFAALSLASMWKLYLKVNELESFLFPEGVTSFWRDFFEMMKPKLASMVILTSFVGYLLSPAQLSVFSVLFGHFLIACVVAGSAILNCYLELEVDKKMERTRLRTLPAGRLRPSVALWSGCLFLVFGFVGLILAYNFLTAALAIFASFLYLYAYTPLKQKSLLALFVGAVAGAIPPVLGWTLGGSPINAMPFILFSILFIWQLPHFLAISIFHREDYAKANIVIFPEVFGLFPTRMSIVLLTIGLVMISLLPFVYGINGRTYYGVAMFLGSCFFLYSTRAFFLGTQLEPNRVWAKRYFWGSLIYLPLILSSMMFFE